ncbi:MAG: GAF domain-containing protein [Streptomycetales bacterium]
MAGSRRSSPGDRGERGDADEPEEHGALPELRLDELLQELRQRIDTMVGTRDRVRRLWEAVLAVGSDLEFEQVLKRIVEAAAALVDARYGALGVLGENTRLARFISVGIDDQTKAAIGHLPEGRGVLGLMIDEPHPVRVPDLRAHPSAVGFPRGHPPMTSFLGVPIRVRGKVFGNLYLTDKRGGAGFDAEDEIIVSALAAAAGVTIENARLYDEGRRRERWLAASSEVTRILLSGAATPEVLTLMTERARDMTNVALVAAALPEAATSGSETANLVVSAATGAGADKAHGLTLPRESLAGEAYLTATAVTSPNLAEDPRATPVVVDTLEVGPAIYVPIGAAGQVRGILAAWDRVGMPPFPDASVRMLEAFAAQAAVVLELAERRRDAERLALLEDRDRIARDLHDLVIQRLFATGMALESASPLIHSHEALSRVMRAVDSLDQTIKEIRSTVFALQSSDAERPAGLRARVLEAVKEAEAALGFAPVVRLEGLIDTQVPGWIGEQLLAVVREALSNVARHARAGHVEVLVEAHGTVLLRVQDDGCGVPAEGRRSGLRNLAERARALGGELYAGPVAEGGTLVEWRVPLPVPGDVA